MNQKNRTLGLGLVFFLTITHSSFAAQEATTDAQLVSAQVSVIPANHLKMNLGEFEAKALTRLGARPIALIYDGPGACVEGCANASADMAYQSGFYPIIVGPRSINESSTADDIRWFFEGVKVWIQPGGYSRQAYEAMTPALRNALTTFIFNGGGYVGFCAGAFITTQQVGTTGTPGFHIFPGKTAPLMPPPARPELSFSFEEVNWAGKKRAVYFEGGPYLYDLPSSVEVVATYSNGKVAAARTTFGKGKVFIAGPHPEAPGWWYSGQGVMDRDGLDHDLAHEMIHWAAAAKKGSKHP